MLKISHVSALYRYCLVVCLGLATGCSHYAYDLGTPLSVEQQENVISAVTLTNALDLLGPPLHVSALSDGFVLAWEHWDIRETKIGISLGFAGVEAMSMDWGNTATKGQFLLLTFNKQHRLLDSAFMQWNNDAGGGQAIQPFGGLLSVADVDDLIERMPQHRWGASSLDRLPVTLNRQSDPGNGANGVEQRGTPRGAGQRVLEMD